MRQPLEELLARSERESLASHPFLQRLRSEPVDLGKIYLLMLNARELSSSFVTWLASLIVRVEDTRIRSFLGKQLNDELGNGDPSQVHILLYDALLERLSSWKPAQGVESFLAPGRELKLQAEKHYLSADPYEGLGALIVGEVHAEQFNVWFGGELARHKQADPASFDWYVAHEEAEAAHAKDSLALVNLLPEAHLEAVRRGGEGVHAVLMSFLGAMYRSCFSDAPALREATAPGSAGKEAQGAGAAEPVEVFTRLYDTVKVKEHPLFRRLRAEPFNPPALWLVLANLREASADFVRWLSAVTAGVDDDRIRSVLARQLNDELGKGDYERRHTLLFTKTLEDIASWRPAQFVPSMLGPGRGLRAQLGEYFLSPDAYRGVGASMIGEVCAEQFDTLIAEQMRRKGELGASSWVVAHEEIEAGHAEDSTKLARLISTGKAFDSAAQGAEDTLKAFMLFLDKLNALCFA